MSMTIREREDIDALRKLDSYGDMFVPSGGLIDLHEDFTGAIATLRRTLSQQTTGGGN